MNFKFKRKATNDLNNIEKIQKISKLISECVCGSKTHQRRSHKECPLNKKSLIQLDFDEEFDPEIEFANQNYNE